MKNETIRLFLAAIAIFLTMMLTQNAQEEASLATSGKKNTIVKMSKSQGKNQTSKKSVN